MYFMNLTVLFFGMFFCHYGCMTTKGIIDESLSSTEPYIFEYNGNIENLKSEIKRLLLRNGFTFADEDVKAGILSTKPKQLTDDECIDPGFASYLLGSRSEKQTGRLFFIFTPLDSSNTKTEFFCKLLFEGELRKNVFESEKYSKEGDVSQGHPLMIKYRNLLKAIPNMTLKTPVLKTETVNDRKIAE